MRRAVARAFAAALLLVAGSSTGDAQEDSVPRKHQYNLFHRTPAELRRPLTTDRPDRTESPYTVDAGLFQVELDLVSYSADGSADGEVGVNSSAFSIAPINLKAGMLPNVDLQLVLATWASSERTVGGTVQRQRGLGAIAVRTKVNLWGNDGGRTAFAVMPFVAFVSAPGSSERVFNLGVILPLKVELGAGWGLSSMLEFDVAREGTDTPRRAAIIGSASVGRSIVGPLAFYVEGYGGTILAGSAAWEVTGDVGLTLGLGSNVQLDAGLNLGFTRVAEDVNPFLGLAVRF